MTAPLLNPRLTGFACIRCAATYPVADYLEGCPSCLAQGFPASVAAQFDTLPPLARAGTGHGLQRFADRLGYTCFPSLGEGDTPLLPLHRLATELDLDALHIKCESANPTGSHKDRMSAQFIARALDIGAPGVVAASSGNAGASLAAYAAAAGLACTIVSMPAMPGPWRRAIEMAGASIHIEPDSLSRWRHVRELVRERGWLPATNYLNPPVGSHPFGVDGYKTLGYELAESEACIAADVIIVPTARGDLLWGIYRGLQEQVDEKRLGSLPRLVAVDPFARLSRVLAGDDYRANFAGSSPLVSINGPTVTYQSVAALEGSHGLAVAVDADQAIADQVRLALEGLYLELSSAASLSALRVLKSHDRSIRRAVLVGTSSGYKEETRRA